MERGPRGRPGLHRPSYDNTGELDANTWRHVAFIEQEKPSPGRRRRRRMRWLMSSDVCKHCTSAACLEVCPTGALFRTEFGTVVVQQDVCNGCGYCVPACPYGVIDRREDDGRAQVHPLLRPAEGRHDAGLREGVPDGVDPVRPAGRAARARAGAPGGAAAAGEPSARLYGDDPGRRRRRRGLDLPAPRRARGLRPAARPGGHHARPRRDVAGGGGRGRGAGRGMVAACWAPGDERSAPVSQSHCPPPPRSPPPTTGGR